MKIVLGKSVCKVLPSNVAPVDNMIIGQFQLDDKQSVHLNC